MVPLRILSVFGTRPEAIKMAPVVRALAQAPGVESRVCVTAQHREMLDQVLKLFGIVPDVDLNLMRPGQSLAGLTAAIFTHLAPVFDEIKPDWVLVQGDTTTVMAASLLAYYHRVKVGHVEAGLRTGDKWQPFPEEINRRVASVAADLHFAPTDWARQNLLKEGIACEQIVVTGNTVIDALQHASALPVPAEIQDLLCGTGVLPANGKVRLMVVTAHRRENFGEPFERICTAIRQIAERYGDAIRIVYPVHLNPNVQEPVYRLLKDAPNIILLSQLDYLPMVHLLKHATLLLTDSGGLQEEAPGLGVPVLVMRDVTERPEGVAAGTVRLAGTRVDRIVGEACRLFDDPGAHAEMAQAVNPYGDGQAAGRIVQAILANSVQGAGLASSGRK